MKFTTSRPPQVFGALTVEQGGKPRRIARDEMQMGRRTEKANGR
jgi:hypothetical protein